MIENLLKVHEDRVSALIEGDLKSLDRCVSDDLVFTTPYGTLLTKTDIFDKIKDGKMVVNHMQIDDLQIRQNGDTAIITYRCETAYTDNNVMVDGIVRSTTVYVHRDNRWQLIAAHQSTME